MLFDLLVELFKVSLGCRWPVGHDFLSFLTTFFFKTHGFLLCWETMRDSSGFQEGGLLPRTQLSGAVRSSQEVFLVPECVPLGLVVLITQKTLTGWDTLHGATSRKDLLAEDPTLFIWHPQASLAGLLCSRRWPVGLCTPSGSWVTGASALPCHCWSVLSSCSCDRTCLRQRSVRNPDSGERLLPKEWIGTFGYKLGYKSSPKLGKIFEINSILNKKPSWRILGAWSRCCWSLQLIHMNL